MHQLPMGWWPCLGLLLAVLVAVWQYISNSDAGAQPSTLAVVPRQPWTSIQAAVDGRVPIILEDSPGATRWPSARWSVESLAQKEMLLSNVYQSDDPVFTYWDDGRPIRDGTRVSYKLANLSSQQFFDACRRVPANGFRYYSGGLADLSEDLLADTDGQPLCVQSSLNKDARCQMPTLWIGQEGVVTPLHYDAAHNAFIQVVGRKRVRLLPPANSASLRLHPWLHPSARTAVGGWGPAVNLSGAMVASLFPGDLLYIPPYWWHEVKAQDTSVSLSVWTDAPEVEPWQALFQTALPFEGDWDSSTTLQAALSYLGRFFVRSDLGRPALQHLLRRFDLELGKCGPLPYLAVECRMQSPAAQRKIETRVEEASLLLQQIHHELRAVYISNYVEEVLWWLVGTEGELGPAGGYERLCSHLCSLEHHCRECEGIL